jgi:hypothetical protein
MKKPALIALIFVALSFAIIWHLFGRESGMKSVHETMAFSGHGILFDKDRNPVKLDSAAANKLQDELLALATAEKPVEASAEAQSILKEAEALAANGKFDDINQQLARNVLLEVRLLGFRGEVQEFYGWRNEYLLRNILRNSQFSLELVDPAILDILRRIRRPVTTDYINDCRAHDVPIPPDFALTGTPWNEQGTLSDNLLQPGSIAHVWTYNDPAKRGVCIALPRGAGGQSDVAGIICQSATTGHACFWDNIRRDDPLRPLIPWSTEPLVISELMDGSNLRLNCTSCHQGNNVFNIAPQDSTWTRVMRGVPAGSNTASLTVRVESSTDRQGGKPRYIPISGQSGWANTFQSGGCGGSCHEQSLGGFRTPQIMPATCAVGNNVDLCYR